MMRPSQNFCSFPISQTVHAAGALLAGGLLCIVQGCSSDATPPPGPTKVTASSSLYPTENRPFQALVTASGAVLVSVQTGVQVFTQTAGGLKSNCVQSLPAALVMNSVDSMSFFPGATDIALAVEPNEAAFYHTADISGCGALSGYHVKQGVINGNAPGTFGISVSQDGNYAFVANEYALSAGVNKGNIDVIKILRGANGDFTGTGSIGQIWTSGRAVTDSVLSPDGNRLYVTSEIADDSSAAGKSPVLSKADCTQGAGRPTLNGVLTVIDTAAAKNSPTSNSIRATINAGCSPVRSVLTADGKILWVAARGDNRVLAFSTALLESNPENALIGYANTGGTAPIGIKLFHNDQLLAVANSNRFNDVGGIANATILNVADPAAGRVMLTVPTGEFPRNITVGPDGSTLFLTNYRSNTLQVIATTVQ
jgi:DNA-binding beta-propeller fold protein YncE